MQLIKTFLGVYWVFLSFFSHATTVEMPESLEIGLHSDALILPKDFKIQFGLPVPPNRDVHPDQLSLWLGDQQLPLESRILSLWPEKEGKAEKVRALLLSTKLPEKMDIPQRLTLKISEKPDTKVQPVQLQEGKALSDVTQFWWPVMEAREYNGTNVELKEPIVYVTLPATWLSASFLKTKMLPFSDDRSMSWFIEAAEQYGRTIVNDSAIIEKKYRVMLDRSEPWMYDRVATLFQLYFRTGHIKWLQHAHRAAFFYRQNISQQGYFELKGNNDLKMSYSQGLWLDYLILGDSRNLLAIKSIAKAGQSWDPLYQPARTFFTERHQAYAFWALLTAWEAMPQDKERYRAALNFFEKTYLGITTPPSDWKAIGCYVHEEQDHEGNSIEQPVCSPWMSALLGEAIWKYFLLSRDNRALDLLSGFGDYIVNYATYSVNENNPAEPLKLVSKGRVAPWYLAGEKRTFTEKGFIYDKQHSCDVAGLLARSIWAKRKLKRDASVQLNMHKRYLAVCKNDLFDLPQSKEAKKSVWPIKPFRKYNWVFGSTHDSSWLVLPESVADF